ncbi:proton-conducting transporter transmembrane domain-containing protein [Pyrococcus abyssi]|uniref:NADH ubiquinone oxidoreductase subunit n=1 Tax=Pyrococcus abyssi (strain GE5 / Orsay) TaxID=272844 RepID=Q9V0R4_PYRAB|nr:proton-conducting transporter membrane subunit [Pyrococcus abyssi]CAB49639.1 NADH ubiquinone oxidoreductase subunit [Pyrococcus abyssi GE5]CCE70119.1 TPA: putative monovalent cation/H+ antiporter subunit D [Pyrococcus abyssi GE5]
MTWLPFIIIIPLFGAFSMPIVSLLKGKAKEIWATIISFATLIVGIEVFREVWSGGTIVYALGSETPFGKADFPIRIVWEVDKFGAIMVLIITFVSFLAILYSLEYMKHDTGLEKYYTLILILELGMLGIAITGDIFNFYVFLEIMSIASYALVAFRHDTWEGIEAGIKYMFVGSLASSFVLLGIALLYGQYGTLTMGYLAVKMSENPTIVAKIALALFLGGLLFKSGAAPVHMWLADAHPAAPSSISAMLSGLVIKIGGIYAIARVVFSIFWPAINPATVGWIIIIFACITLIVGNAMAVVQEDMKRLLAYSSVGQIGYILLGLGIGIVAYGSKVGEIALAGAIYHTVNHALMKALLFLVAGVVLHELGTRNLNELSGLAKTMPKTTFAFLIGAAAIVGMPPLNGFASKWLIYESSALFNPLLGAIAIIGTAFCTAAYVRVLFTFFGRPSEKVMKAKDPGATMLLPIFILVIAIIGMGLFPWQISDKFMVPAAKSLWDIMGYVISLMGGG